MTKRLKANPILFPENSWENKGAFNPNVIKLKDEYKMLYRAIDDQGISRIALAQSLDGLDWQNKKILIEPSESWDKFGCEDPRVTFIDNKYYIFYTAISQLPPNAESIKIAVAISDDLNSIKEKKLVTPFNAKAGTLFSEKINNQYFLALTANTDKPPSKIAIANSSKIEDFWNPDFWQDWYKNIDQYEIKLNRLNTDQTEIGATPLKTPYGWLWFYCHIRNYYNSNQIIFGIEAFLSDLKNPGQIISRTDQPLLTPKENYEILGQIKNVIFPSGSTDENNNFRIYYGATDTYGAAAEISKDKLWQTLKKNPIKAVLKLDKYNKNPILTANLNHYWENKAVYNPALVYEQNTFYLLYRALSKDMVSSIGCATSRDGFHFENQSSSPAYIPRADFEKKKAEGNYSGCEDPRIVKINDKFYMFYTAYNGISPPRVAITSINVNDFINQNWEWSDPILISPPDEDNKDACLFPEKINGKYLILHRSDGKDIAIDWLTDLSGFSHHLWLEKEDSIKRIEKSWEGKKIGLSTPPIKTKNGWLLLYHGVSDIDQQYRIGAMMLDLNNPSKVLSRTKYPTLEPTESFEKIGLVNNVVFPCGAAVANETLFVAYGGADQVVCMATIKLKKLLDYLEEIKY